MEQKVFQSFLNEILSSYPNDLIQPTYQKIFEGLNQEQGGYFGQILLNHPNIVKAYAYCNVPAFATGLRLELLKDMFPRYGRGPGHWKEEKTFIVKERSNDLLHGSDILIEEFGRLKIEIANARDSIPQRHIPVIEKLNNLSEEITNSLKSDNANPLRNMPELTISEDGIFWDYPDSMTSEQVEEEIKKEDWGISEFLTECFQFSNSDLRNDIFDNPIKVIFRHRGKEKRSVPFALYPKEKPLFAHHLKNAISLQNKNEPFEIKKKIIETEIQVAIHEAAKGFPSGLFEKIQGYYKQQAEWKRAGLGKEYSRQIMSVLDDDEFKRRWDASRDEISVSNIGELNGLIDRVFNERYFDAKIGELSQGTPLGNYVTYLIEQIEFPESLDEHFSFNHSSEDDENFSFHDKIPDEESPLHGKIVNPEEVYGQKEKEKFIKKAVDRILFRETNPLHRRILVLKRENPDLSYEAIGKEIGMTRQGVSQFFKGLSSKYPHLKDYLE